jgi:hypothetical protein
MTTPELKDYKIAKATWVVFCNTSEKKVNFLKEFRNGGSAHTALELIMKPSKAEALAEIKKVGYTYEEPKAK